MVPISTLINADQNLPDRNTVVRALAHGWENSLSPPSFIERCMDLSLTFFRERDYSMAYSSASAALHLSGLSLDQRALLMLNASSALRNLGELERALLYAREGLNENQQDPYLGAIFDSQIATIKSALNPPPRDFRQLAREFERQVEHPYKQAVPRKKVAQSKDANVSGQKQYIFHIWSPKAEH